MRLLPALFIACLPAVAMPQEVLGRSQIEGRAVVLYADGTWDYNDSSAGDCALIARLVSFCGAQDGWESTLPPNNDVAATYRFDDRHYGQMIIEELGTNDGLTSAYMRDVVIENAAAVIGRPAKGIAVLETYRSSVSGRSIDTIVYAFNIDGLDVVYANGIHTAPERTMQLMTFSIGTEFTQRHRDLHAEFLTHITIGK